MNLVRCGKGHYFDGSKYASCPHCGANLLNRAILTPQKPSGVTVTNTPAVDPEGVTVCRREVDEAVTVARNASDDDLRTIAKYSSQNGTRMVVGWLLCTEGADRGADYRLYAGNNTIGRGDAPDIRLYDDPEICRGVHCVIAYDPKQTYLSIQNAIRNMLKDGYRLNETVEPLPKTPLEAEFIIWAGEMRKNQ